MKRLFTVLVLAAVLMAVFVVIGPQLPEGNPIRGVADAMRAFGSDLAGGFGGGYRPLGP